MALLLGFDVGSSSVKATLLEAETGKVVAAATSPKQEMPITALRPGWAEQDPALWWRHCVTAVAEIRAASRFDSAAVAAIGISYQMHGLVAVDSEGQVLRPAIIWCDSRAVPVGQQAAQALGTDVCLEHFLNLPGNFTASKLRWVQENEPEIYRRIHKILLPGDYIAYRLTGRMATTVSGLSEGILWDFQRQDVATLLLEHYGIAPDLLADRVETFGPQGTLTAAAAAELGLPAGTPVTYRGGDQPNNALSLNVLEPGEIAATAGTSGVVYGVTDQRRYDPASRVNTFVHVNHQPERPRYGVLLCVNGTGILNSWLRRHMGGGLDYAAMNEQAAATPIGAAGLTFLPFGNGAERTLGNRDIGAGLEGLNFNIHDIGHVFRAAQEGIVFALAHGLEIMEAAGVEPKTVRAGHANMFLSPLFGQAFADLNDVTVELYDTDGSQGAARGAGLGAGLYAGPQDAFVGLDRCRTIEPDAQAGPAYREAYGRWRAALERRLAAVGGQG